MNKPNMLGQGTLVLVTPRPNSARYVDWNGALWIVDSFCSDDPDYVWCRSLATGGIYDWHKSELTLAKEEQDK